MKTEGAVEATAEVNTRVFDCQFLGVASRLELESLCSELEALLEVVLLRVSPLELPPAVRFS